LAHPIPRSGRWAVAAILAASAAVPAAATAAPVTKTVSASASEDRACHLAQASGQTGVDTLRVTAPASGLVRARLSGQGDWDLGVFDAQTGRSVAGSAGPRSVELAEGFVNAGQPLLVQACRFRGTASSAALSVDFETVQPGNGEKKQLADVKAGRGASRARLQALGLDLTEHADGDSVEVVLHGQRDAKKLADAGFAYDVRIADLAARAKANREADDRFKALNPKTHLPSSSSSYRRLPDYELDLKRLAMRYPSLAKPITLPNRTIEGREVHGLEITEAANAEDGKPIFLQMGVHHAREWPSGEHAIEFAHDLLRGYGTDARTTDLMRRTRTIVVPLVNPDGFNVSREAQHAGTAAAYDVFDYEMKRKNCRPSPNPAYASGSCADNPAGGWSGVDPNRNYGGLWGGPGASTAWSDATFRGPEPFSEPETRNIRQLISTREVAALITNHTYSNLILRPPGVADMGFPVDEPYLKELGARMATRNGYSNDPSYGLYDTTGGTEDWTYWTAGALGYTFEIGPDEFHPPFNAGVVDEYLGRGQAAGAGRGGNRGAYFDMLEATAAQASHAVLRGSAPAGSKLTISKAFETATSPVWQDDAGSVINDPIMFDDRLEYSFTTQGDRFDWHVNPSTRPVVDGRVGRDATGPPQANIPMVNPPGPVAENTSYPRTPYETFSFDVEGPPEVDNGRMNVHIDWANPDNDWDVYVRNSAGQIVASSASYGDNTEDAILFDPPPGRYTAHVVNWDQVPGPYDDWKGEVQFRAPMPNVTGETEAWTFTCTPPKGNAGAPRAVTVKRGQAVDLGSACGNAATAKR
jgi:murein tripeptide amidase MpaA